MSSVDALAQRTLDELLERFGTAGTAPGGGTAASIANAMGAALIAMVARQSGESWPEAGGAAAQAAKFQARSLELAQADEEAFADALAALDRGSDVAVPLDHAAWTLLELAETGADVAELAAHAAERCDGAFRGDAIAAAALAEAAVKTAAALVALTLTVAPGDERLARIRRLEENARGSLGRALDTAR